MICPIRHAGWISTRADRLNGVVYHPVRMPGGRGTPHVTFRADPRLWERFTAAVAAAGLTKTAVLHQLIRWWLREGPAPQRPGPPADAEGP